MRQPGQERVPGQYEPRDPHPDDRDPGIHGPPDGRFCSALPTARCFLTTVRRNGEHLLQLINDILDLSKIEAGKMVMDLGPCHLPSTVADVASMMRPRAEQHGNTLEVRLHGPVAGDHPHRWHQAPAGDRQPGGERGQVHGEREHTDWRVVLAAMAIGSVRRERGSDGYRHRHSPGSAVNACSSRSRKPRVRPPGGTGAPAWGWRSPARLSRRSAAS